MSIEEMTLEQLAVAACTSDSSQPYLREAAQAELARLGVKPLGQQWADLEKERDEARAEVARLRESASCMEGWLQKMECHCGPKSVCARCVALANGATVDLLEGEVVVKETKTEEQQTGSAPDGGNTKP